MRYGISFQKGYVNPDISVLLFVHNVLSKSCFSSGRPRHFLFAVTEVTPLNFFFQDGRPLPSEGRVSVLRDGSLRVQEARAGDVGEYRCTVSAFFLLKVISHF